MKAFSRLRSLSLPTWLRSDHPGLRAFVALFSVAYIIIQTFGNLPDSFIRQKLQNARIAFDYFGLYERGWGMFAATNSSTSTVRAEFVYADGSLEYIQYIF